MFAPLVTVVVCVYELQASACGSSLGLCSYSNEITCKQKHILG